MVRLHAGTETALLRRERARVVCASVHWWESGRIRDTCTDTGVCVSAVRSFLRVCACYGVVPKLRSQAAAARQPESWRCRSSTPAARFLPRPRRAGRAHLAPTPAPCVRVVVRRVRMLARRPPARKADARAGAHSIHTCPLVHTHLPRLPVPLRCTRAPPAPPPGTQQQQCRADFAPVYVFLRCRDFQGLPL